VDAVADRWGDRQALRGGVLKDLGEGVGDAEDLLGQAAGIADRVLGVDASCGWVSHDWPASMSA